MSAVANEDRLFDIKGAATFLRDELNLRHVTEKMVRHMADRTTLPFFKMGRTRVIYESKLRAWLARQQAEAERAVSRAAEAKSRRPRPPRR